MTGMTREQAIIVGRIRDALRALGYRVPHGNGPGTFPDLIAMTPAIAKFAASKGPAFARNLRETVDPTARARKVMQAAESKVLALDPMKRVADVAGVLADGFMAFRAAKKKGGTANVIAGLVKSINAATSR